MPYEYQSVATDSRVTVAPPTGSAGRVGNWVTRGIDIDIVVAAAVHLGEVDCAEHGDKRLKIEN